MDKFLIKRDSSKAKEFKSYSSLVGVYLRPKQGSANMSSSSERVTFPEMARIHRIHRTLLFGHVYDADPYGVFLF